MTPTTAAAEAAIGALADPLRWRIVTALADEELCVCHLVETLGVGQSLVSHHLRVLRDVGFVHGERHRYWTYYRLDPSAFAAVADAIGALGNSAPVPGSTRRPCC